MDLNKFGKRAFKCALRREKIHENLDYEALHVETVKGLQEEFNEVVCASETDLSEHLNGYSSIAEELADCAIVAFTELYRRGIDIECILHEKMTFNERRIFR